MKQHEFRQITLKLEA